MENINDLNIHEQYCDPWMNVSLEELLTTGELGLRAYKVVRQLGLTSLKDIILLFLENKTVSLPEQMGKKSEWELTQMCEIYINEFLIVNNIKKRPIRKELYRMISQSINSEKPKLDEESEFNQSIKRVINNWNVFPDNTPEMVVERDNKYCIQIFRLIEMMFIPRDDIGSINEFLFRKYMCRKMLLSPNNSYCGYSLTTEAKWKVRLQYKFSGSRNSIKEVIGWVNKFIDRGDFDFKDDLIVIDDTVIENINNSNQTNFREHFIVNVLEMIYSNEYALIRRNVIKPQGRKDWFIVTSEKLMLKNNYFIKKEFDTNDFINWICFLKEKTEQKRDADVVMSKPAILKTYWSKYNDDSENHRHYEVLKTIARIEFDLHIDDNGLFLQRNTPKARRECIIDVLTEANRPMHLNELFKLLNTQNPELFPNESIVQKACLRFDEVIFFGRSSTYGLKCWETEKEGIKGGTIRNIVIEFLMQAQSPVHIHDIVQHVCKFRNTSHNSVMTNLKLIKPSPFIFYESGYVEWKK